MKHELNIKDRNVIFLSFSAQSFGNAIKEAFKEYEQKTCLQFKQRTTENDYVEFIAYAQGFVL